MDLIVYNQQCTKNLHILQVTEGYRISPRFTLVILSKVALQYLLVAGLPLITCFLFICDSYATMWWPIIGNKFILFYSISLHKYEFSPFLMQFQNAGGQFQKDENRSESFGYAL